MPSRRFPHRWRAASSNGRVHHDFCAGVRLRVRHPRHLRPERRQHPRLRRPEPPRSRSTPKRPYRRPVRSPMHRSSRRPSRRTSLPFRTCDRARPGRVRRDCVAGGPGRSSFPHPACRRTRRHPRSSPSTPARSHRVGDRGPPRVGRHRRVRFRILLSQCRWRASRSSCGPCRPCRVRRDCAGASAVWLPSRRSRRPAPPPRSAWIPLRCSFRPRAGRALRSSVLPSTPWRRRGCRWAAVLGGSGRRGRLVQRASEQPASSSRRVIVVDVLDARERGDLVARLLRRFIAHAKNPFPGGPPGRGSPGSPGAGVAGASPSSYLAGRTRSHSGRAPGGKPGYRIAIRGAGTGDVAPRTAQGSGKMALSGAEN